ncbi:unnamed protein product [Paramecium primaurelia]|uniref:Methyltransferase domain-containing protein n=1 Tax=Paramecium primaurelia TaxID=5886 RepID=A0A8S1MT34_PARPR|nr:unnamed protein product [Paramecium primaurelia]
MLNEPLFQLIRIIKESGLFKLPIVRMKRFIEDNLNFLLNYRLIQILIKFMSPFFESIIKIIKTNKIWKVLYQINANYLIPFYIWIKIDSFIKNVDEKLVTIPIYDQIVLMFQNSILNEPQTTTQNTISIINQYAITQFWKNKTFKDQIILELECGNAGGLSFIAETYGPQICIGIDSSENQIQNNIKLFNQQTNLKFQNITPNELRSIESNKVDIIIGIELNKKLAFRNINIKSYLESSMNLLKEEGYLIISDFDTIQNLSQLEDYLINIDGLKLIEKQNLTIGLALAMQLQIAYIKQHQEIQGNWISKLINKKLRPHEQRLQQIKDRQKLYMVYVLRKSNF